MPVRHVTLTPNTVATVTAPGDADNVAVFHKGNVTNPLWVTVNDVDPTAGGDDTYYVPSGGRRTIVRAGQVGTSDVRILSAGAVTVEVEFS